jgi:1,2-diacylglycerol 3-alpha-glucosyltransferase
MRVGLVSTYPPIECGIATYTQYLNQALRDSGNETFVMSQHGAQGHAVFPVFQAGAPSFATDVFSVSARMTPDLVHIQHEYGLFGAQRGVAVIELILRYRLAGMPVAITLHTVSEEIKDDERLILKHIVDDCSAVIVHEEFQRQILLKNFGHIPDVESKIHVIEHGIREVPPIEDAKSKLDLAGKKVILLCGYFRPSKGFHRIVDIFPGICRQEEDAVLVVAGKIRNIQFDDYRAELFSSLNNSPVSDRITILRGQFPQHTFDTIIAAADVVVLPYELGGQSGIMAQCFAQGVPVVTSDLQAFRLIIDRSKGGLVAKSDADFEKQILRVLGEDGCSAELKKNIRKYVKEEAGWTNVAKKHCDVYHGMVNIPYGKARYVYFPEPGAEGL